MVSTVSKSPSSARTYLPRPLHGPDCFTVSILLTHTVLGSWWYFDVLRRSCYTFNHVNTIRKVGIPAASYSGSISISMFIEHYQSQFSNVISLRLAPLQIRLLLVPAANSRGAIGIHCTHGVGFTGQSLLMCGYWSHWNIPFCTGERMTTNPTLASSPFFHFHPVNNTTEYQL